MLSFIAALVLMLVALVTVALLRAYYVFPVKELKRQARTDDPLANALYRAAAYGTSLALLLWIVVIAVLAASFGLLVKVVPSLLAFVVEVGVIGVGLAWVPQSRLTRVGSYLALWLTPLLVQVLEVVRPVLDRVAVVTRRHSTLHTGLFEREDLRTLLERQKTQTDSRIAHEEIDLLVHALTFGEKSVYDSMVPRKKVRSISTDETISPVVIRELHESGYSRFPVFEGKPDNIVGTLYLRDVTNLKAIGQVKDVMDPAVYYVHEEYPLEQALHAFLKTKHHVFIVVNKFEEFVGIITIEDILEQILGCKIVDEFDAYDDRKVVAADHAPHEPEKEAVALATVAPEMPEGDSVEATEVVE